MLQVLCVLFLLYYLDPSKLNLKLQISNHCLFSCACGFVCTERQYKYKLCWLTTPLLFHWWQKKHKHGCRWTSLPVLYRLLLFLPDLLSLVWGLMLTQYSQRKSQTSSPTQDCYSYWLKMMQSWNISLFLEFALCHIQMSAKRY